MIFFAVDIGQYGGYLPVSILVRNDLDFPFSGDMCYRTVRVTEGYSNRVLFWRIRRQNAVGLVTHSRAVVIRRYTMRYFVSLGPTKRPNVISEEL